jgi:Zn-dependent protease
MFTPDRYAIRIAKIAGIEVRLHVSVTIIFVLIVMGLGNGVLPEWHPDWGMLQLWGTALTTGLLFFGSLLAHELSHSLVAQAHGIAVPRITLFLFGGVAEMEREADSPKIEFLVAGAGPLMSFALSILFFAVFLQLAPPDFAELSLDNENRAMSMLSETATASFWLASVNLILGVFNLVPGFPLDGGRLFRAFLWWRTGDQVKATRRAAETGRLFGWTLIALGLLVFLRGNIVGGAWLALIGWFLSRLAAASVSQLMTDRALKGLRVEDLMRTSFEVIDGELPIDRFVNDYLLRSSQLVWPVRSQGKDVGVFSLHDITPLDESTRSILKVREIMQPIDEAAHLHPGLSGHEALKRLADSTEAPLPVLQGGRVVGLIHQADILKWLALHSASTPSLTQQHS